LDLESDWSILPLQSLRGGRETDPQDVVRMAQSSPKLDDLEIDMQNQTAHLLGSQKSQNYTPDMVDFNEIVGEFGGYRISGNNTIVKVRYSFSFSLPRSASEALRCVRIGDMIGILLTDSDSKPVRVRRFRKC
jgi:hypothetical protein